MNLRVVRRDLSVETISVVGPAEVHHGDGMDRLHSADGMDYFFLQDGTYDGWGQAAASGMTMNEMMGTIERVERERRIEPTRSAGDKEA